jgi:two-component system sensor histidine kinase GlrK
MVFQWKPAPDGDLLDHSSLAWSLHIYYQNAMQLTIFKRLTLGYGAFVILLLGLGVYVAVQLNRLNRLTWAVVMQDGETVRLSENLDSMAGALARFEKKHLVTGDAAFFKRFQEIRTQFLQTHMTMQSHVESEKLQAMLSKIGRVGYAYFSLIDQERELMGGEGDWGADIYHDRKADLLDEIRLSLQAIMGQARQSRDQKLLLSSQISVHVIRVGIVTIGIGGLIGLFISFFNAREINRSIQRLQQKTHDVANSRFDKLAPIDSPPEIAALTRDFNRMCDRLEELNDMKEDFIYHVSHELRTPLTAIREASSMLLEGCYSDRPNQQNQLLNIVRGECERLIESINRMLDLSRMEAQMMEYAFETIDILPLVRSCILKLAPIALTKDVLLELKPSGAQPHVRADRDRLYQLMENLIGNALKYTDTGGKVRVALQQDADDDDFLRVAITDTGCGIPQSELKSIFDKFRRIDDGQDTKRGTGLGLSIAKHIVMAHGGKIWATSLPESGSAFYFTLPLA